MRRDVKAVPELVVNHSFRFADKLRRLRRLVREEGIPGEVHSVSAQFRMELLRNSTHLLDTLVYLLDARARTVAGHVTGENEAVDSFGADRTVDRGAENRSPGVEDARSLEVIVGIYLSHYTGGQVEIPLDRPLRDVAITSW